MTQWRCDTCSKPGYEDEMIEIVDELGVIWFRHKECCEKYRDGEKLGTKPRTSGQLAQLEFTPIVGGIERHVIRYGPPPRRMDILDRRTYL